MRFSTGWLLGLVGGLLITLAPARVRAETTVPIGVIQGIADESAANGQYVTFRGVVTAQFEDVNTRGIVYYTIFVQELPEAADGDPATSDGIAVFLGRDRPYVGVGDQVLVSGRVTEFYGLTELDDEDLYIAVEQRGDPLPDPVAIDPPAGMAEQTAYFEALEGMRVAFDGEVVVAGPTHEGCGFAVIDEKHAAALPMIRRAEDDPAGQVVPVLYPSDLDCSDIPQVKTGDRLNGVSGVLVYNFDQFKIVLDSGEPLTIAPVESPELRPLPGLAPGQISVISLNAEDYFDTVRHTDDEGEPVLTAEMLAARREKLVAMLADIMNCPTIIGLQEVEHAELLADLAGALADRCGFVYSISHLESPDSRGIDNALMSDPRHVAVSAVTLRQTCSPVPTDVEDETIVCESGQEPLFGRPPLQVDATIGGEPTTFFVNHFKSKRGGEIETGLERIRQAVYLNSLATDLLADNPSARIIALGDFNDTELAPVMALLAKETQGGRFTNVMERVPQAERYSYNFGGVAELIDSILVSPSLVPDVSGASVLHTNTDFPVSWRLDTSPARLHYRISDHDIPIVILGQPPPRPTATIKPSPSPTATIQPTAIAVATIDSTETPRTPTPIPTPAQPGPPASGLSRSLWMGILLGGAGLVMAGGLWLLRKR